MILLLLHASVTAGENVFLGKKLVPSTDLAPPFHAQSDANQIHKSFTNNPRHFCVGFKDPLRFSSDWSPSLRVDPELIQQLYHRQVLQVGDASSDPDDMSPLEEMRKPSSKGAGEELTMELLQNLYPMLNAARDVCNASTTISRLPQIPFEQLKGAYFLQWYNCVYETLGQNLAYFKYDPSLCTAWQRGTTWPADNSWWGNLYVNADHTDDSNDVGVPKQRPLPELPCEAIEEEFYRAKISDIYISERGNPEYPEDEDDYDDDDDEDYFQREANPSSLDGAPEEDTSEESLSLTTMATTNAEGLLNASFFEHPSKFCMPFEDPLRFNGNSISIGVKRGNGLDENSTSNSTNNQRPSDRTIHFPDNMSLSEELRHAALFLSRDECYELVRVSEFTEWGSLDALVREYYLQFFTCVFDKLSRGYQAVAADPVGRPGENTNSSTSSTSNSNGDSPLRDYEYYSYVCKSWKFGESPTPNPHHVRTIRFPELPCYEIEDAFLARGGLLEESMNWIHIKPGEQHVTPEREDTFRRATDACDAWIKMRAMPSTTTTATTTTITATTTIQKSEDSEDSEPSVEAVSEGMSSSVLPFNEEVRMSIEFDVDDLALNDTNNSRYRNKLSSLEFDEGSRYGNRSVLTFDNNTNSRERSRRNVEFDEYSSNTSGMSIEFDEYSSNSSRRSVDEFDDTNNISNSSESSVPPPSSSSVLGFDLPTFYRQWHSCLFNLLGDASERVTHYTYDRTMCETSRDVYFEQLPCEDLENAFYGGK